MLAPLALAACGFLPAYAPGQAGAALHNRVEVEAPSDQNSYLLTRELEERLGRGANATFALTLTVTTSERQLAARARFDGALGAAVRNADADGGSLGVEIRHWRPRRKVKATSARVGDASVTREDIGGGIRSGFRS